MQENTDMAKPGRLSFSKALKPLTKEQLNYAAAVASIAAKDRAVFHDFCDEKGIDSKKTMLGEELLYRLVKASAAGGQVEIKIALQDFSKLAGIEEDNAEFTAGVSATQQKVGQISTQIDRVFAGSGRSCTDVRNDCQQAVANALNPPRQQVPPPQALPAQPVVPNAGAAAGVQAGGHAALQNADVDIQADDDNYIDI
jgi:hypothetical protein